MTVASAPANRDPARFDEALRRFDEDNARDPNAEVADTEECHCLPWPGTHGAPASETELKNARPIWPKNDSRSTSNA